MNCQDNLLSSPVKVVRWLNNKVSKVAVGILDRGGHRVAATL